MYYAVQSIHFNDRAPSLFWLSKSTAITTEYNFTHTRYVTRPDLKSKGFPSSIFCR